jgi:peptide/nickel transport system permease protein
VSAVAPSTAERVPTVGRRASFWRDLGRNPVAIGALAFLSLLVVACVAAGVIAPHNPRSQDLHAVLQGPSGRHLLGTDSLGRDVLSRLLYGGQRSLLSVAEGMAVVLALGVPLGLIAGYAGGWIDRVVAGISETLMALPAIILVLVVLAVKPHDEDAAMIAFGLLGVPTVMRVVRSAALTVREELYVAAARVAGLTHARVVVRHILPRTLGPIIVQASLFCAYALIFETGLAYLGVTGDTSHPTWGGMVGEASTVIEQQRWLLFPSGATIALTILALGLLGDAVRDAAVADRRRPQARHPRRSQVGLADGTGSRARADASALLLVEDLCVVADDGDGGATPLVDGVTFHVRAGETVGLVGESGCGKTVTALAVLRLLPAGLRMAGGTVSLDGRDLRAADDRAFAELRGSAIAYVSQEPQASLDPTFTVASQLGEVIRHHDGVGRAAARRRVLELLTLVEMRDPERVARSYPHELSGGMAQRVALALALAGRPRLLIADEPTTALDVTVQAEILALLRRLQTESGMAVLVITHNWGVVADLCDRTVVMYAGQDVEEAEVQDMFEQPLHPYTLGLLASHPSLARRGEPMVAMLGRVPPPGAWPAGCRFAERCPFVVDECRGTAIPPLRQARGRMSRCIRVEHVVKAVRTP